MSKIIAVIGATGAQGLPVVRHLLSPSEDGTPSPWKVRALTRNTRHRRALELQELGAELVQGSFTDSDAIHRLFEGGVYGAYVNTDGFTVGIAAETTAAFQIWEIAQVHHIRHFVWSNLDYALRLGGYSPVYSVDHYNGKGRFAHYLEGLPNPIDQPSETLWTVYTNGPYMDMLQAIFAPFKIQKDGTRIFAAPIGDEGVIPLIALDDLGWWARYIFDHPETMTGKNIEIASQPSTYPEIVEAFKVATGLPAVYKPMTMDEYFTMWNRSNVPVASEVPDGKTWEENFRAFFAMWRDRIVHRDMDWIRSIHEPTTLEKWMKDNKYTGRRNMQLLKGVEDFKSQQTQVNKAKL
ncbi:NAD(P)-binding protein [Clavulina sp. PMI_390]|nr:NAD(P)-binding protein [Clavulina sp. PMI_390]